MDQFLLKFMKPETEDVNGNEDPKELSNIMPSQRYQDNKKLLGEIHDEAQVMTDMNAILLYTVLQMVPFYVVTVEELYCLLSRF